MSTFVGLTFYNWVKVKKKDGLGLCSQCNYFVVQIKSCLSKVFNYIHNVLFIFGAKIKLCLLKIQFFAVDNKKLNLITQTYCNVNLNVFYIE